MKISNYAHQINPKVQNKQQKAKDDELVLVAVGDSLTAGMQDATLDLDLQRKAYPALIAKQAGIPFQPPEIHGGEIPTRIFEPGDISIGKTLWKAVRVGLAAAVPLGLASLGINPPGFTLFPLYHAAVGKQKGPDDYDNFAVPGFELRHLHEVDNVSDYTKAAVRKEDSAGSILYEAPLIRAILQEGRGTKHGLNEVDRAINKSPDLVTLWAGNNDILSSALSGAIGDKNLTPFEDRQWLLNPGLEEPIYTERVMPGLVSSMNGPDGVLSRLLKETDSHIMLMNVPDVTVIPHLLTVGEKVGKLPFEVVLPNGLDITERLENFVIPTGVRGAEEGDRSSFPEGTRVGLGGLLAKFYRVFSEEGPDQMLELMGERSLLKEDDVLDPQEIGKVQKHVQRFNALLAEAAEDPRVHLVDVNALLTKAKTEGVELRGEGAPLTVGAAYTGTRDAQGREGLFSLDGVHPADVGQAVVANLVLDVAKENLADNPRFESLVEAEYVDEKAVFQADERREGNRPRIVLGGLQLEQLRAVGGSSI